MKLEMERMEFQRDESGDWVAEFTVREENGSVVLRFSEYCRGSTGGDTVHGSRQELSADKAVETLFSNARARLRKVANIA